MKGGSKASGKKCFRYVVFFGMFLLIFISLFGNALGAKKVLYLDLKYDNETFYEKNLYVNYGKIYIPKSIENKSKNKIVFTDKFGKPLYENNFSTKVKYLDIPQPKNVTISMALPYKGKYRFLKIKEGREIALKIDLRKICNGNDVCEKGEDFFSCPNDCSSGSDDGVCDKVEDGICDPDCLERTDPDCQQEKTTTTMEETTTTTVENTKSVCGDDICEKGEDQNSCPEDCSTGFPYQILWVIMAVVIVIISVMVVYESKKAPRENYE